jgi:hypothetical protein
VSYLIVFVLIITLVILIFIRISPASMTFPTMTFLKLNESSTFVTAVAAVVAVIIVIAFLYAVIVFISVL